MVRSFHVNIAASVGVLVALVAGVLAYAPFVSAQGTSVNTTVCNSTAPSSALLTISSPNSGSVSSTASINVVGTIKDLTQVQIIVDGQYSNTVPVDANQQSISTTINLSEGTHVIKLIGVDVCQIENPEYEFAVTYEPAAVDSQTPTETASVGQNTVGSNSGATAGRGTDSTNEESPLVTIPRVVGDISHNVLDALNISSPEPDSESYLPAMTARFALVFVGSIAIIWPELMAIAIHHKWFIHHARYFTGIGKRVTLRLAGIILIIATLIS